MAYYAIAAGLLVGATGIGRWAWTKLTWKDEVRIVQFRSEGDSVFFNAGSGPVYLVQASISAKKVLLSDGRRRGGLMVVPLHKMAQSGEFTNVRSEVKRWRNALPRTPDEYSSVLERPDSWVLFFDRAHPTLLNVKASNPGLFTVKGKARLTYYSLRSEQPIKVKFPCEGFAVVRLPGTQNVPDDLSSAETGQ